MIIQQETPHHQLCRKVLFGESHNKSPFVKLSLSQLEALTAKSVQEISSNVPPCANKVLCLFYGLISLPTSPCIITNIYGWNTDTVRSS